MANYLITGGAGFIGSHLVEHLIGQGESVRVLDNFSTGPRKNLTRFESSIDLIEGDACEPETARAAVADMDFVLHHAAIPSVARSVAEPVATTRNNIMSTVALLEASQRAKVKKFVYAASSSVYGDQAAEIKEETLTPAPQSPYAVAKLSGEQMCQAFYQCFGLECVCLRYFNVFGPRQDPDSPYSAVIPIFIRAANEGKSPVIYGDGRQSRDFTYVANVVGANALAVKSDVRDGRPINVACGGSITLLELVASLGEILGQKIEPKFSDARPGDVLHSRASIERARSLLGYEVSVDFTEGLRRTAEAFGELSS